MAATTCCFIHKIPHVKQHFGWDCGLASAEMIVRCFGPSVGIYDNWKRQSVWTIDIAYLLHRYGIKFKMYTTTLQADESYAAKVRTKPGRKGLKTAVLQTMLQFENSGIALSRQSFSLPDILHILSQGNPIVALVNANSIYCEHCSWFVNKFVHKCLRRWYQGHYIVVVGFDEFTGCILYRDPAVSKELCCMKYNAFESARKCPGTDEDMIVVQLPP